MLFNEFGNRENKKIILMPGMMQDWSTLYEILKPLEKEFFLIVPAMDGFYDNCPKDFTDFPDQCRQIEEYVKKNFDGKIDGVYGISQGATIMSELLARNNIAVKTAVLDGVYVAHQGKLVGIITANQMIKMKNNGGNPTGIVKISMKLMGMEKEDTPMFQVSYWGASDKSIKNNSIYNYTYRANPDLVNTKTKVYLWCGSKEPYAIKSHKILKKYLKNYEEEIISNVGHAIFLYKRSDEMCKKLAKVFNKK